MLNKETIENYKVVDRLVRDKFDLTKESQELFTKLLFNPEDAIEFEKIASQPDRRLFIEVDSSMYEKEDPTWANFIGSFPSFIKEQKITFNDYMLGKTKEKKIITAFVEHTVQNISGFLEMMNFLKIEPATLMKAINDYFPKNYEKISSVRCENIRFSIVDNKFCIKVGRSSFKKVFNPKEVISVIKEIKKELSNILNTKFFGVRKTYTKYVCLSLNFADWLLASTGDSWSSCLGLDSENGYWRGLAGLIGDKNRLMIFITDKKEKSFRGIKSFKMLERCWAFLYKDFLGNKFISTNKLYPNKIMPFNLKPYIDIFGKDISYLKSSTEEEFPLTSLYLFPTIFHKPLRKDQIFVSTSIYEDMHEKIVFSFDLSKSYYSTENNDYGVNNITFYKNGNLSSGAYKDGAIK